MGMFSDLMGKIFHHGANAEAPPDAWNGQARAPRPGLPTPPPAPGANVTPAASPGTPGGVAMSTVDVGATLDKLAAANHEKLDWKHSIVDLMKLVGMDSSLASRKELAKDLHYTGDTNDSAAMNMWLHKEVMTKLSENGGKVPAELLSH